MKIEGIPSLKQINVELAKRSLLEFTKYTFPDYDANWHHELTCDYLDAFVAGEITRLMIFMPPRHGKSELVSRRLPAYILGKDPKAQIISASYGADLARRMNRDVQRIIDTEEYRDIFPETTLFGKNVRTVATGSWLRNSDLFEVVEYGGYYRSSGVGGAITGMGMQYGIIDDPFKNREEADSETIRQKVWDWYTSTFRTRLAKAGGILLTVTRWHEDDLAGRLIEKAKEDPNADQWEIISLPAIADGQTFEYDQREEDEPLWPNRFNKKFLLATESSLGDYDWNSLYQQRPSPSGGAIFKSDWWSIEENRNRYNWNDSLIRKKAIARWHFWDTALKDKDSNDYSAMTEFELWPDYTLAVRQQFFAKIEGAFLPDKIEEMAVRANSDEKLRAVVIEDKQSGTTAIQTLRATAPEWLAQIINEFQPHGTKEYRARQASIWCARDCVKIPLPVEDIGKWYFEMFDSVDGQLFKFPNSKHDDLTDSLVMGILYLENYLSEGWHARNGTSTTA